MLKPDYTTRFKKDTKAAKKRSWPIDEMKAVMSMLVKEIPLSPKYEDHALGGNWKGCRECHIRPDWLLIYQIGNGIIVFVRTGTHSDLFP